MNDSLIFYRSYYEALRDLPRDIQGEIYTAIMEYGLYGNETDNLKPVAKSIFTLIKPNIDRSNKLQDVLFGRRCSEYKHWRDSVLKRDNFTCIKCGNKYGELNAHHIKPFSTHPELRYDLENGITLCKKCHIELHKHERLWQKTAL